MAAEPFENEYKVKLVSMANPGERVVFDVMPNITVSAPVEYSRQQPLHAPGSMQIYKNTAPRTFTVSVTLVSRNVSEATQNQDYLHRLLSWRYGWFGMSSTMNASSSANDSGAADSQRNNIEVKSDQPFTNPLSDWRKFTDEAMTAWENLQRVALARIRGEPISINGQPVFDMGQPEMLGAPPPPLYFFAYSSISNETRGRPSKNINRIPVVLENMDYAYVNTVDYIPTLSGEPFPVRMELTITLTETHSPREMERFSLEQYKNGMLRNY